MLLYTLKKKELCGMEGASSGMSTMLVKWIQMSIGRWLLLFLQ